MDLQEIMQYDNFVVLGNTIEPSKYAYKIKKNLEGCGYNVASVYKELDSINEVDFDIDVLCLCINRNLGIKFLRENEKPVKAVVIQPNAGSPEIVAYLNEHQIPFIDGCLLVGCSMYNKHKGGSV